MTDFITSVDLHEADSTLHDAVDRAMESRNFSKTHVSPRGVAYRLPAGTYFSQSFNMSSADVRNLAASAVAPLGRRYDIVTVAGDIAYFLHPAA